MTVIRNNSISGINSITAQSGALNFYDSTGNTLAISADVTGGVTVATGATISGSTNTIIASTNGSERVRINSSGNVGINTNNPSTPLHVLGDVTIANTSDYGQINLDGAASSNDYGRINFQENGTIRSYVTDNVIATAVHLFQNKPLLISTNNTERVRITGGGDVQIANGNLVFSTAGTGIDFSANSNAAGMTSELLDDYEEGTFTPELQVNSNPSGILYNSQGGNYTKIGNVVHINIRIQTSNNGSNTGGVRIAGLPFTVRNTNSVLKAFTFTASGISGEVSPWATVNTTVMPLYYGLGTYTSFTDANWPNGGDMHISGYYYTD